MLEEIFPCERVEALAEVSQKNCCLEEFQAKMDRAWSHLV